MEKDLSADLEMMFKLRKEFLHELKRQVPSAVHDAPLDLTKKSSQMALRESALRGVEEMFEALQLLKNSKPHRKTELSEFHRDDFLEEVVDAFNYFFNMLIYVGVEPADFFEAYKKKHEIIMKRLEEGY